MMAWSCLHFFTRHISQWCQQCQGRSSRQLQIKMVNDTDSCMLIKYYYRWGRSLSTIKDGGFLLALKCLGVTWELMEIVVGPWALHVTVVFARLTKPAIKY